MAVSGDRIEFALQLYNLLHALRADEAVEEVGDKIEELQIKISRDKKNPGMKSFYTKKGGQEASRKRHRTGDGAGGGTSAGGGAVDGADYWAELRTHGYEVQPEVIVNASGIAFEYLFKV